MHEGFEDVAEHSPRPVRLLAWRSTPVGPVALGHGPPPDASHGENLYSVAWAGGVALSVIQPREGRKDQKRRIQVTAADGRQWFLQKRRVYEFWRQGQGEPIHVRGIRWRNPWTRRPVGYRDDNHGRRGRRRRNHRRAGVFCVEVVIPAPGHHRGAHQLRPGQPTVQAGPGRSARRRCRSGAAAGGSGRAGRGLMAPATP